MYKILCMMLAFVFMSAQAANWDNDEEGEEEEIVFDVGIIDEEGPVNHGHHKVPVMLPRASYSNHVLTFKSIHPEYELQIVQCGAVIYSTTVSTLEQQVTLPTYNCGGCQLVLIQGYFKFTGHIII